MRPFPLPGKDIRSKALVLQIDPDDDEAEQRARRKPERNAKRAIEDALQAQKESFINPARQADDAVDWFRQEFEQAMSELRFSDSLRDNVRDALFESTDLGIRIAVRQLDTVGIGFDWTIANEDARQWAQNWVGQLIANIDSTTIRMTRSAVANWIDDGRSLDALIEELAPIYGADRAELIASTEVTRAYAEGNFQAYSESGVVQRWEWRTAMDERVCPICGPLHGVQLTMGESFTGFVPDDIRIRDDISAPPAHPRCRCWVVPVIGD